MFHRSRPARRFVSRAGVLPVLFALFACPAPAEPDLSIQDAVSLYRKGDFRAACPVFARLAAGEPSNALPHLYLLGCAIRDRAEDALHRERETLNRLVPKGARAYAMAGFWLAKAAYCREAREEFAMASPPAEAGSFEFAVAQCHQERGEIESAIENYRKAVTINPGREEYALSLSFLLMAAGEGVRAGQVLADAFQHHPQSVRLLVTMSLLHLELGYPGKARMGYVKARAIAPDSPMVWKLLGRIQTSEGAYRNAVQSFEQAARFDPKDAQIPLFLGMALIRTDGGSEPALAAFLQALKLDPSLAEARFQAANIYFQVKEDYQKAAGLLETVLETAPGHVRARQLLVQSYYRLGRDADAAAQQEMLRAQRDGS